eukprot:m.7502 g.7502  ORF g.7502 m.7502 type:complete len:308 (+) comp3724_c0_seq1:46-969(+)
MVLLLIVKFIMNFRIRSALFVILSLLFMCVRAEAVTGWSLETNKSKVLVSYRAFGKSDLYATATVAKELASRGHAVYLLTNTVDLVESIFPNLKAFEGVKLLVQEGGEQMYGSEWVNFPNFNTYVRESMDSKTYGDGLKFLQEISWRVCNTTIRNQSLATEIESMRFDMMVTGAHWVCDRIVATQHKLPLVELGIIPAVYAVSLVGNQDNLFGVSPSFGSEYTVEDLRTSFQARFNNIALALKNSFLFYNSAGMNMDKACRELTGVKLRDTVCGALVVCVYECACVHVCMAFKLFIITLIYQVLCCY